MDIPGTILLSGVVGSFAYGLAGPGSDVDKLGIYAAPTVKFHGLSEPPGTKAAMNPDITFHEAKKYCTLALGCNPTVLELMWLGFYEITTPFGLELVSLRQAFLSKHRVRYAYLGYALQQFNRLKSRGDGSFSSDTRKRTAKHARHLMRLCHQGYELYRTGSMTIRLEDPQRCLEFGEKVAAGNIDVAESLLAEYERRFDRTTSPLPESPDRRVCEDWLIWVRAAHFQAPA